MDSRTQSNSHGIVRIAYGLYAWIAFLACVICAVLSALFVPGLERRRRWVAFCARMPFVLAGIPVDVRGLDRLPDGECVVVANHASYLDGVLLHAFLPPRFSYVIKSEVHGIPVMGFLLERIGSRFVDRFDTSASARDARGLLKAARNGESLAFFPEGTFIAEPGLGRFRLGAFAAATRAGIPVVPVVISGSRQVLPSGTVLPRRGPLRIDVLDALDRDLPAYADNRELAELSRQRILSMLDEPDLLAATDA
jgi:1-acyl-sn-glycerol-3-phosphate acyltransferase